MIRKRAKKYVTESIQDSDTARECLAFSVRLIRDANLQE